MACGAAEEAPETSTTRRRIASLSPSTSELLIELGAGFEIVAADAVSCALPALRQAADLGELQDPALAVALAESPDLVVGLATPRVRDFSARLEKHGVTVHLLDARDADAAIRAIHHLGELLGRPTRAASVAAARVERISRLAVLRDGRSRLSVAWLIRCDPLTVVAGTGLVHEVLELAGAENSFHRLGTTMLEIDAEQLAEHAPDVVLDSTGRDPVCFDASTVRVEVAPADLVALPAIDLYRRVLAVHGILYGDGIGDEPVR